MCVNNNLLVVMGVNNAAKQKPAAVSHDLESTIFR